MDLAVADLHVLDAAGDLLVHGGVGVEGVAALIDVGQVDGVADRHGPGVDRLLGR